MTKHACIWQTGIAWSQRHSKHGYVFYAANPFCSLDAGLVAKRSLVQLHSAGLAKR
jgi:hypothetical protein